MKFLSSFKGFYQTFYQIFDLSILFAAFFLFKKTPATTYSYGNDDVTKDADPAPMLLITPLDFHATLEDHLEEAVLNIRNPQKASV